MYEVSDCILTALVLVDVTTQTIETIWPLSAAHGMASADQNLFSLRTFVLEVLKRSKTSYSTLLVAIYYLVVIMSKLPSFDFTMEQMIDSDECRAMQCGRRMFLAALILASKYLQDRNYSTRAWGKISGLKPYEINTNERVFLEAVNWKLHLPEPLFHRWERIVLKYSPSGSAVNVPRSSPAACQTWRSIVRQLNADLDQFDNHGMLISDNDSAYYSESSPGSSRGTSPHAPRESGIAHISTDVTTAAPYSLLDLPPLTMEPPVQDSKPDNRMLPPLQPREGPLPTPQITPQFKGFCTPAVSASGLLPRRSSMSIAMTEHRRCFEERLLDRPYTWGPTSDATQRQFNRVPSSLSLASSPPDSILSDVSLYPSRSSSISSVASSNCALPEPCLASEAVRRCADMKMSALVDKYHLSEQGKVTDTAAFSRFPVSPRSCGNEFYFKERPKMPRGELINKSQGCNIGSGLGPKICSRAEGSIVSRVKMSIPTTTQIEANSDDSDDDATPKPRPAIAQDNASPTSRTYQAAAALVDLTLDQNPRPRRGREPPRVNSLKRGRTFSVDCELQSSVQGLLRPQSSRNTNPIGNRDTIVVIPDKAVADSRLSKGSHRSSPSHSEALWADFDRRCIDSEDETKNREVAEQLMKQHAQNSYQSVKSSSESSPRKKPCCSTRSLDPAQKLRHSEGGQSPPIQQGLSVRKGGGNVKPVRSRPTGQYKPKTRGSRKPAKEMEWLVRSGQADFAEMHDSALGGEGLLYGEVRSW